MRKAEGYDIVQNNDFMRGYIEQFSKVSIDNDIPAMLSFFFIQGQIAAPYLRIYWDETHLDPRVHMFWIQPSRTGKSIAWEFIGDVMDDVGLETVAYTTGSDAGLVGGTATETIVNDDGKKEQITVETEGMLGGQKALNFDEGSIILNPGKHSQETVLYLQSACNPIGSNSNKLVKHLSGRTIETESLASMWITTFPPKGVKEYVLTKGIFQRVLLYWAHWDTDRRKKVSRRRVRRAFTKPKPSEVSYDDIVTYFTDLEKRLRDRVLNLSETTFTEWDEMDREDQEDILQDIMFDMFSADDSFYAAADDAIDDYYSLLDNLDFTISDVVASFVPAMENYTVILATHMALMDNTWTVTGRHVDMAKDILYDLFKNLIQWLEGEVEVGAKKAEKAANWKDWLDVYNATAPVELDKRGEGWRKKAAMLDLFMVNQHVTKPTAFKKFNDWAAHQFDVAKDGRQVYLRLKEEAVA
tara:strand:+ start:1582 stop:2991 length:1410 start_codon:yes stop_codon:yes gene_type:complete